MLHEIGVIVNSYESSAIFDSQKVTSEGDSALNGRKFSWYGRKKLSNEGHYIIICDYLFFSGIPPTCHRTLASKVTCPLPASYCTSLRHAQVLNYTLSR